MNRVWHHSYYADRYTACGMSLAIVVIRGDQASPYWEDTTCPSCRTQQPSRQQLSLV